VNLQIADAYHRIRLEELELTAASLAELGSQRALQGEQDDARPAEEPQPSLSAGRGAPEPALEAQPHNGEHSAYTAQLALRLYDAETAIEDAAAKLKDIAERLEWVSRRPAQQARGASL